jgi:hypothetical protein
MASATDVAVGLGGGSSPPTTMTSMNKRGELEGEEEKNSG